MGTKHNLPLEERFWPKVAVTANPDKCWEWTAGMFQGSGYGSFAVRRKNCYAHRVAYQLYYGKDPGDLDVLHKCDNVTCCNPHHLFLGTHTDNMRDRNNKGRANIPKGEQVWDSKLTEENVTEALAMLSSGMTQQEVADVFGVDRSNIGYIKRGKIWKHITSPTK